MCFACGFSFGDACGETPKASSTFITVRPAPSGVMQEQVFQTWFTNVNVRQFCE
jgi:hypothetical protein